MARIEVAPFEKQHCEIAGSLLARRHRRHREFEPLLDGWYEDAAAATAEVLKLFEGEGASGAVACSKGEIVGYLLGAPRSEAWGANAWVEVAGHAVEEAETFRDLYAFAAQGWVDQGMIAHYALVPASDVALVDAWFSLSFGLQHVHAVRDLDGFERCLPPPGVVVRPATRTDARALAEMGMLLPDLVARSPVFSSGHRPTIDEALAECDESIEDPEYIAFLAERDGVCLGSAIGCVIEKSSAHSGLARPSGAAMLAYAAVRPEARDRGIGRALTSAVAEWAVEGGYRSLVTDWRSTNLPASRTWPRFGFRPTFLRVHRRIS